VAPHSWHYRRRGNGSARHPLRAYSSTEDLASQTRASPVPAGLQWVGKRGADPDPASTLGTFRYKNTPLSEGGDA